MVLLAIEERDVFRFAAGSRIRERAEFLRVQLADKSPDEGSSDQRSRLRSLQVDLEGFADVRIEDRRGRPQVRRVHRTGTERPGVDARREVTRIEPEKRRVDVDRQRFSAAEDLDLGALGGVRRGELHAAVPEQHERGRSVCRLGNERAPGRHLDDQVWRVHSQIVNVVLFGGVQREPVEAADDRQTG